MLQVQEGDIPKIYNIECAASVAFTEVQSSRWITRYQLPQPPVIPGTPSTSTTATYPATALTAQSRVASTLRAAL